jgi:hypothetical protein
MPREQSVASRRRHHLLGYFRFWKESMHNVKMKCCLSWREAESAGGAF